MLWTKRAHQCTIFRLLGALMKVHPIPHAILETTRSGFIQTLHHYSVSQKITPLFFLAQTSYTLDKNSPLKWHFWTLSGWVRIHQIPHVIFETTSQFFFKLCITLQCHGRKVFCTFLAETLFEKESTTVQNFRLSTAQVKFHQICTLIGYFCWKYIKFKLKNYGGNMSHDTKEWFKFWKFWKVSKMTRIRNTEESWKIWRKTDLWSGKWHEGFDKFSAEHLKVSKLVFSWESFDQSRKCMSCNLQRNCK